MGRESQAMLLLRTIGVRKHKSLSFHSLIEEYQQSAYRFHIVYILLWPTFLPDTMFFHKVNSKKSLRTKSRLTIIHRVRASNGLAKILKMLPLDMIHVLLRVDKVWTPERTILVSTFGKTKRAVSRLCYDTIARDDSAERTHQEIFQLCTMFFFTLR